ncbi:MAG: transcription termination factor NusA [Dehalococcoidia bacterium]|jgi:N utilization substance protein A
MKSDFLMAITQLAAEKNLPKEMVLEAVEAALASAYKKDNLATSNVVVRIDRETGLVRVFTQKAIVEEVTDPRTEMSPQEARALKPGAVVGDVIDIETVAHDSGRIAAQTAKQVVLQRLREAEREVVFEEYSGKEGDIVSGVMQRFEGKNVVIDLGKAEAVLPPNEQVKTEHYRAGQRLKLYLLEVIRSNKGPQVTVSRTHKNLLRRLFELEVPEIFKGTVELRAIAREAGHRSKVAVYSSQEGIDPVGACVGLRGIRIQNIVNELGGERIDVVQWDPDAARFVANALSPAQVVRVTVDEAENTASVVVPDRQLSLAIGKEGQNARLAAKLTGWRIDIRSESIAEQEQLAQVTPVAPPEEAVAAVAAKTGRKKVSPAAEEAVEEEHVLTPEEEAVLAFEKEQAAAAAEAVAVEAAEAAAAVAAAGAKEPQKRSVRFAEELLTPTVETVVAGKGKRAKAGKGTRTAVDEGEAEVPAKAAKPKKAKKSRRPIIEEDEEEEFIS